MFPFDFFVSVELPTMNWIPFYSDQFVLIWRTKSVEKKSKISSGSPSLGSCPTEKAAQASTSSSSRPSCSSTTAPSRPSSTFRTRTRSSMRPRRTSPVSACPSQKFGGSRNSTRSTTLKLTSARSRRCVLYHSLFCFLPSEIISFQSSVFLKIWILYKNRMVMWIWDIFDSSIALSKKKFNCWINCGIFVLNCYYSILLMFQLEGDVIVERIWFLHRQFLL